MTSVLLRNRLFLTLTSVLSLGLSGVASGASPSEDEILKDYRAVQTSLAKDQLDEAKRFASELGDKLKKRASAEKTNENAELKKMREGAQAMATAKEPTQIRKQFGNLSEAAVALVKKSAPLQRDWKLYQCPMVKGYGYWLQPSAETVVMNPYMGSSMQQCGMTKPLK